jgi:Flagellar hook-length control protein FliK
MNVPSDIPGRSFAIYSCERVVHYKNAREQVVEENDTLDDSDKKDQSAGLTQRAARYFGETGHDTARVGQADTFSGDLSETHGFSSLFGQLESRCTSPQDGDSDMNETELRTSNDTSFDTGLVGCASIFDALIKQPTQLSDSGTGDRNQSEMVSRGEFSNFREADPYAPSHDQMTQSCENWTPPLQIQMVDHQGHELEIRSGVVIPFGRPTTSQENKRTGFSLPGFDVATLASSHSQALAVEAGSLQLSSSESIQRRQTLAQSDLTEQRIWPPAKDEEVKITESDSNHAAASRPSVSDVQNKHQQSQFYLPDSMQISGVVPSHLAPIGSPTYQISENMRQSVGIFQSHLSDDMGSAKTLLIKLQPEGLGEVQLSFRFRGGKAHVHLSSSQSATRDILQLDTSSLISEIRKIAPSLELVDLSFSVKSGDAENRRRDNDAGMEGRFNSQWNEDRGDGGLGKNAGGKAQDWSTASSSKQSNGLEMVESGRPNAGLLSNHRIIGDAIYL